MEGNVQARGEISLAEIFRILFRKIKVLLITLLIGVVIGATLGVVTTVNTDYYGTSAEFYVNPKKTEEGTTENDSQYGVYGAYGRHVMDNIVKLLSSDFFAEQIALVGTENNNTPPNGLTLEQWRQTAKYKTLVNRIKRSVSYSYYDESEEDVDDLAKSFIYVRISVLNDKEFAEELFTKVRIALPAFVTANMAVPTGYSGTNCIFISTLSKVNLLNDGYTTNTAVKYAVILGAAAFVVACIVVIVIDRSDKRLRNYEEAMARMGVPVLGVIPSIEQETEAVK
ncbi:MAG: hypothetical protein IJX88_00735 [Clostridia bacterium]|nr:hypothetical protein [Clostridia bacterium]